MNEVERESGIRVFACGLVVHSGVEGAMSKWVTLPDADDGETDRRTDQTRNEMTVGCNKWCRAVVARQCHQPIDLVSSVSSTFHLVATFSHTVCAAPVVQSTERM